MLLPGFRESRDLDDNEICRHWSDYISVMSVTCNEHFTVLKSHWGTSLVVQCVGLCASITWKKVWSLLRALKILKDTQCGQKYIKPKTLALLEKINFQTVSRKLIGSGMNESCKQMALLGLKVPTLILSAWLKVMLSSAYWIFTNRNGTCT